MYAFQIWGVLLSLYFLLARLSDGVPATSADGRNRSCVVNRSSVDLGKLRLSAEQYRAKHPHRYYVMPLDNPFGDNFQCTLPPTKSRIVGGSSAKAHSLPWMVFLTSYSPGYTEICGGFLISNQWILTAAHCVTREDPIRYFRLELGMHSRKKKMLENIVQIKLLPDSVRYHENYVSFNLSNDIALIKLPHKLMNHPHIKPICLPPANYWPKFGETCGTAGWGLKYPTLKMDSDQLREINVDVRKCLDGTDHIKELICAGTPPSVKISQDSCAGDSGGPLVCNIEGVPTAVGVLSGGNEECNARYHPAQYTRITSYLDWIKKILRTHGGMEIP